LNLFILYLLIRRYHQVMNPTKDALINILDGCNIPPQLLNNSTLVDELLQCLSDQNTQALTSFSNSLKTKFNLNEKTISTIVDKISQEETLKTHFGRKILILWLRYQLHKSLDIHRES
jgi:hypothetical protein